MKSISLITFAVYVLLSLPLAAQERDKYQAGMEKWMRAMDTASGTSDWQKCYQAFSKIGETAGDRWEPWYYASYSSIQLQHMEQSKDRKEYWLAQADKSLVQATRVAGGHAELLTLDGYIKMMYLSLDPAGRGPQLSGQVMALFQQALAIDAENPRALMLSGQMELGMASFFGQTKDKGCSLIAKSVPLFDRPSDHTLAPAWGKEIAMYLLQECQ